jgi:hypothetical protein
MSVVFLLSSEEDEWEKQILLGGDIPDFSWVLVFISTPLKSIKINHLMKFLKIIRVLNITRFEWIVSNRNWIPQDCKGLF